jgi:CheY-like chemotaxis protein
VTAPADHGEYPMDRGRPSDEAGRTPRDPSRILIVDDIADTRQALAIYFRYCGFIVETASDGVAAIEAAHRLHPDVIVMDVTMPRLDGLSAMREINHDPHTADIPVVILTAYPIRAIKGGALDTSARFVMKPCTPQELGQHVCSLLEIRRSGHGSGDR